MGEVSLRFHAFHIRREGFATDDADDYLEGDVDFDLVVDGAVDRRLAARVKQSAGATLADPLEIPASGALPGTDRLRSLPRLCRALRETTAHFLPREPTAPEDERPSPKHPAAG